MEFNPNATANGPTNPPVPLPLSVTNKAIVNAMYLRQVRFEERHPPDFYTLPPNSNIRHIPLGPQPERDLPSSIPSALPISRPSPCVGINNNPNPSTSLDPSDGHVYMTLSPQSLSKPATNTPAPPSFGITVDSSPTSTSIQQNPCQ